MLWDQEPLKGSLVVPGGGSRRFLLALGEDTLELIEHELHNLALENHVDRHIVRLGLGAEQRGSKHNGDALNRHPVRVFVLDHPTVREEIQVKTSSRHVHDITALVV